MSIREPMKIRMVKSLRFLFENNMSLIIFQPIVKRQRTMLEYKRKRSVAR